MFARTARCSARGIPGCTIRNSESRSGELTKTMVSNPSLPAPVREVAILVTGAHFKSAYELYAHVIVAERRRHLPTTSWRQSSQASDQTDLTRPEAVRL